MTIRLLTTDHDLQSYEKWVNSHLQGSIWQSLAWKKYQEALGREVRIYELRGARCELSALVVIDRTTGGFSTWEIPRGPLGNVTDAFMNVIIEDAKRDKCMTLFSSPKENLTSRSTKLAASDRHIQPDATLIIDLTKSEDEILAQMKQKGRYNIKVAQKHGVVVEESEDIGAFYELLKATTERDGFTPMPRRHYEKFLTELEGSFLLIAKIDTRNEKRETSDGHSESRLSSLVSSQPVAGLLGVIWNNQAMYYYGASSNAHRNLMAPYLLQWEAMKRTKALGCVSYDLLGIAPPGAPNAHPWRGITDFKEKFGGTVVSYPSEQVVMMKPLINAALQMKRKILG